MNTPLNLKWLAPLVASTLIFTGCGDSNSNSSNEHKAITTNIIHINDHHSHLEEETMGLDFNDSGTIYKVDATIGGFARVVSKIKSLQAGRPNPITVHAGDMIQGTLYYTLYKNEAPDALMMNQVEWDAVTLGNHEFDDGDEGLKTLLDAMPDVPMISANVVPQTGNILDGYWEPYRIIERDGEKIGLIGLEIGQKTKVSSFPSDEIMFLDEIETTQKYVDELRAQDINKIILVSHFGMDNDLDLATKVDGVDVIIDGDSHSLMGDFSMVGLQSHYTDYVKVVDSKSNEPVCVTSAWQYSYIVGDLQVDFSEDGVVENCAGTPQLLLGDVSTYTEEINDTDVALTDTTRTAVLSMLSTYDQLAIVTPDAATVSALQPFTDNLDEEQNKVIGSASTELGHNRIPGDVYDTVNNLPLGSDIAPLVSKAFYLKSSLADACIQNAGGVRIRVEAGDITVKTAYTLLPFSNTLYEINMKGSEIKQVLEDALVNYFDNSGSTGSFPYAYGLRYDIDMNQAANSRISNLEVLDRDTQTFSTIEDDTFYVIVTNSFTAGGQDGYVTFKTVQDERGLGVDTYYDYAESFVDMVKGLTAEGKTLDKLPTEFHPIKSYTAPVVP